MADDDVFDYRRAGFWPRPVDAALQRHLEDMLAAKARGKKPGDIFRGHASWALGPDSVKLVMHVAENDPWWVESCRFAMFSDEVFFSTIVAAAKHPDGAHDPPTYADTFRFAPRVVRKPVDLPLDMQPHFLFLRKVAPDFGEQLPEICLQLYDGVRRMLASDPAVRSERMIGLSEAGAPHLHLFAPLEDDPAWGGLEIRKGRRFRDLKADVAVWRLRAPATWRHVRLSLPCVIGDSDAILSQAAFEIDGRRMPLEACDIGYRAELPDIARPFDTITLHLPEGERPELCVSTMPEA